MYGGSSYIEYKCLILYIDLHLLAFNPLLQKTAALAYYINPNYIRKIVIHEAWELGVPNYTVEGKIYPSV